ncbi:Dehydrogenase/reductase SDR family protein 7-like [Trichoplax sp. H2]|nr:Dehydrogenase/reductase SDR family protein 7-like [Trichoplax sp. H2]|eukprot:RDD43990.1 Dehydrogenase/reductase SDR family protein 7-like [Trichoplax sp. H2]
MSSRNYQALLKIRDKMVAGKDIDTELIPQILPIDLLKSEQLEKVADKACSITKDDPAQIRPNIFRPVLGKMAVPYRSTFMDKDTDEGMAPEKFAAAMTEYAINEEKDVVIFCIQLPVGHFLQLKTMYSILARIRDFIFSQSASRNLGLLVIGIIVLRRLYKRLNAKSKRHLRGKVVWITGASSGIGEACAKEYFANGAKVIMSSRNYQSLLKVRDAMVAGKDIDAECMPQILPLDLSKTDQLEDIVEKAWSIHGVIDILVNNAGVSNRGSVADSKMDVYRHIMEVNFFAPLILVKDAASKHACQALCDSLRAEVAQHNIKVFIVSPGYVRTNLSLNALATDGSKHGVMDKNTAQGMAPEQFASLLVDYAVNEEQDVVICPAIPKAAIFAKYNIPNLYFWIMRLRANKNSE